MNFKWINKPKADKNTVVELSKQLNNLPIALTNLLVLNGIDTFDKSKEFFRPKLEGLHDPFLMKDMYIAVERLEKALENNENILVYGDYDVDGTTSVALVYSVLKEFTKNLNFYVPDRYSEGYGISLKGIDFAAENNCSLVIALDCGIKAVDKIEYANEKNVDFIICDHHTPGEKVPEAVAVLNPKQIDCEYPYKELSGCGVGFKFMQAFAKKKNYPEEKILEYLDILAISIASDIVPINGENRILEYYGLQKLNKTTKPGLVALKEIAGAKNIAYTVSDVVFKLGPRINAAGRMEHASFSVKLLIENDIHTAKEFADKINVFNETRKTGQDDIYNQVLELFEQNPDLKKKKSTVVYNENWSKGIIGIVASKVIEKYYKPTIVLTKSHDKWTGSARSVEGFNLYEAIDECSHLLHSFGGHKYAAGLTVDNENLQEFIDCFEKSVSGKITDEQQVPKIEIDDTITIADITPRFVNVLKQFAPFGPNNMKPVFASLNVVDTGYSRTIGKTHDHLRLEIKDSSNKKISGIAFGFGHLFDEINKKKTFDICYTIGENVFNGKTTLQLDIKDIKMK